LPATAQINGAPSSVTSHGFGGRPINGTPPSTTSLGPRVPSQALTPLRNADTQHRRHHHADSELSAPWVYAAPVPYAVDIGSADSNYSAPEDSDPEYQGGPTLFDRRGSGASSYIPPVQNVPRSHSEQSSYPSSDDVDADPPQEPTLLIFKDGRKLELQNYAIIGPTLFDLTPGHARKVALGDIDLEATRRQNDDRGITFQMPSQPAN